MIDATELRALRAAGSPEWHDGGDGVLFGHSADESGVWHAGDSALVCAAVNALVPLLDRVAALESAAHETAKTNHVYVTRERRAAETIAALKELLREAGHHLDMHHQEYKHVHPSDLLARIDAAIMVRP